METNNGIIFPRAFGFAVDDLGWVEGSSLSRGTPQGPPRAGVKRIFDLNDYKAIVRVAQAANVRVQCLFILSEMDRDNVLSAYPTTTHQRERWDNSSKMKHDQLEVMRYVREQAAHIEFGFHGTGHEYWTTDGKQKRAEWYNLEDKTPWPEEVLRDHIKAFKEIMSQYSLSESNGHSFPESFVPCAYGYYWNPDGDYSLGKLLAEAGVKYANTDFAMIPELNPPSEVNGGGFDHGVLVIDRKNYGNLWYELSSLPKVPVQQQETDIIEAHWPNWLATDDFLQEQVINHWIDYYKNVQQSRYRYLAKNTEQLYSQWLYKKFTKVSESTPGVVEIDNTAMPEQAYTSDLLGNMVLKVSLAEGDHISDAKINGNPISGYYEDCGFAFLYLPRLEQETYQLTYEVSNMRMPFYVFNDGTYNCYSVDAGEHRTRIELKVYGRQTIKIRCAKPVGVSSEGKGFNLEFFNYESDIRTLNVVVSAADIQGRNGVVVLEY